MPDRTVNEEDKLMKFYVNRNPRPNGDHKIHCSTCGWRPNAENCIDLGDLADSHVGLVLSRKEAGPRHTDIYHPWDRGGPPLFAAESRADWRC